MLKRHLAKFLNDSDAVRNSVAGKIFPGRARQGQKMPYVIISKAAGQPFNDMPGEADYTRGIFEFAVYTTDSSTAAANISELIRNRLSGYSGTVGEMEISGCALETPAQDFVERPRYGSDDWIFVSTSDYSIIYTQALATNT